MPSGAISAELNNLATPDSSVPALNSQYGSVYEAPGDPAGLSDSSQGSDDRSEGGSHGFVSAPGTPARIDSRIARYEAMSPLNAYGGGYDAGFIVSKTDWRDKNPADSPINRFPNEVLIHILSYLEPVALIGVSFVSKRFYALVNSPEAWRAAFVRYFPASHPPTSDHGPALAAHDKRYFTAITSGDPDKENLWRKEYVQRTKLLRSLAKGKVQQTGGAKNGSGSLMVTYTSRLGNVNISHMAINFAPGHLRAISSSVEGQWFSASNPETGKIEKRARPVGFRFDFVDGDIPFLKFVRQDDPRHAMGIEMGVNGVMDISEELGWIVGENVPDGNIFINPNSVPYIENPMQRVLIPRFGHKPAISAVWIAKKRFGGVAETISAAIAVGNSLGHIAVLKISHSKSVNETQHIETWCLSPGVPIVEIKVDEDFNSTKLRQKKPWIIAVNAVGEVYYLCPPPNAAERSDWKMIQQTRRTTTFMYEKMFPTPVTINGPLETEEERHKREAKNDQALLGVEYLTLTTLFERVHMDWFLEVDFPSSTLVVGRPNSGVMPSDSFDKPAPKLFRFELPSDDYLLQHTTQPGAEPWHAARLDLSKTHTLITSHTLDLSKQALAAPKTTWIPGHSARFLAFGTNASTIHIFNIRAPVTYPRDSTSKPPVITPLRTIQTISPTITTLALTSLILVHGGSDGLVQAWDPLASTSSPLRTLHSKFSAKARRRIEQAPDGLTVNNNAFAARCLALDPDPTMLRGIVALGSVIRYWSFSTVDLHLHSRRARKRQSPTGGALGRRKIGISGSSTGRIDKDARTEQADMKAEEEAKEKERILLEKRFGVGEGGLGLDDDEMVAYAEMISMEMAEKEKGFMEEAEINNVQEPSGASGGVDTVSEGLSGLDLEDVDPDIAEAIRLSMLDQPETQHSPPPMSSSSSLPTPQSASSQYTMNNREDDWPVFLRSPNPNKQRKKKGKATGKGKGVARDGVSSEGSSGGWETWGPGDINGTNGVGPAEQEDEDLQFAIRLSLMEAQGRA
ncbi:hypothetical protein EX30DRAFT_393347 [Ascodesmis nigricans]|uniref:F-box domain-containing protein n=1 Tax=Ascodesmis nigricans TaxID=341454 RepID=A0A4S2N491_9PEZI|nr:hypothetical protein EX30DRAFT_393347 [Ascodesmis nigricans]